MSRQKYDLIVLGSGAGGCAAAVAAAEMGLSVCLIEKANELGGGTADSLGTSWIPNNSLAAAQSLHDNFDSALAYARFVAGGQEVPENLEAYVREAPHVLDAFLAIGLGFRLALGLPDYFYPGGPHSCGDGRRMVEPEPISRAALGPFRDSIRASVHNVPGVSWSDSVQWGGFANRRNWPVSELEERARTGMLGCGQALIAQFVAQLLRLKVDIFLDTQLQGLEFKVDRVTGVRCADGRVLTARCGVVLATGGYEGSPDLVRRFEGYPDWMNPFGPCNTGDALAFGTRIGAGMARIAVNNSLFIGAAVPGRADTFFSVGLRGLPMPGAIAVNQKGERFCDETQFQDMVMALQKYDRRLRKFANLPAYMIFDDLFRQRYPVMNALPCQSAHPDIVRSDSISGLAECIQVASDGLCNTIEAFNQDAARGVDTVFRRGNSAFSRNNTGDKELPLNPQLAPLKTPPFYALRLKMGGVCSAGLLTDASARVVDVHGRAIDGLYACGNAAAPTFLGVGYQGGTSIGAGMVFGYLAARHAARQ